MILNNTLNTNIPHRLSPNCPASVLAFPLPSSLSLLLLPSLVSLPGISISAFPGWSFVSLLGSACFPASESELVYDISARSDDEKNP